MTTKLPPLSLEVLRRLPFTTYMHLNRGKEHDLVRKNEDYGLIWQSTSAKPGYRIVSASMESASFHSIEPANLLAKDRKAELERFCNDYNKALNAADGEPHEL